MCLSGLALPVGTKVWPRRFRADHNVVSQQQRSSVMLKTLALTASVFAFASGLAFAETTNQRTIDRTLGRDQSFVVAFDESLACLRRL